LSYGTSGKIIGNWTYGDFNAHLGMVGEGLGKWLLNESYEKLTQILIKFMLEKSLKTSHNTYFLA